MSQVSASTAMTTTPPVTVVSSGMSSLSLVTMAPSLMGLPITLGQHDLVLLPPLTPRCSGHVLGHASVPWAATSTFDASVRPMPIMPWAFCTGRFLFQSWAFLSFCILYVWCLFWCLLSTFRCHAGCCIHPWGLNHWGLHHCNPL